MVLGILIKQMYVQIVSGCVVQIANGMGKETSAFQNVSSTKWAPRVLNAPGDQTYFFNAIYVHV